MVDVEFASSVQLAAHLPSRPLGDWCSQLRLPCLFLAHVLIPFIVPTLRLGRCDGMECYSRHCNLQQVRSTDLANSNSQCLGN